MKKRQIWHFIRNYRDCVEMGDKRRISAKFRENCCRAWGNAAKACMEIVRAKGAYPGSGRSRSDHDEMEMVLKGPKALLYQLKEEAIRAARSVEGPYWEDYITWPVWLRSQLTEIYGESRETLVQRIVKRYK